MSDEQTAAEAKLAAKPRDPAYDLVLEEMRLLRKQLREAKLSGHSNADSFVKRECERLRRENDRLLEQLRQLEAQLTDRSKAFERAAADCVRLEGQNEGLRKALEQIRDVNDSLEPRRQHHTVEWMREYARQALQPRHHDSGGDQDSEVKDA